jgi:ribosomal subunit interface protein
MEIVVRGRNVEVPDHYRTHVEDKVGSLDRFDGKLKILRIDVELFHEKNPRQSGKCQRVEITVRGKGPVVRAEACAPDFYQALDLAASKLDNRMRRAADRRRVHHGRRTPESVRLANGAPELQIEEALERDRQLAEEGPLVTDLDEHLPGRIVREKQHPAIPMTVDQALHEMELVGHDFYMFHCADTGRPTVVYRRHAFDYGLIRLTAVPLNGEVSRSAPAVASAPASV